MMHPASSATPNDQAGNLHVIFGTGPVGCWTARALVAAGAACAP